MTKIDTDMAFFEDHLTDTRTEKQFGKAIVALMPHRKAGSAVYHKAEGRLIDVRLEGRAWATIIKIKTDRNPHWHVLDAREQLQDSCGKAI